MFHAVTPVIRQVLALLQMQFTPALCKYPKRWHLEKHGIYMIEAITLSPVRVC